MAWDPTRIPRKKPGTYVGLEDLGRVRLSRYFAFRDFLGSEIANFHQIPNIPDNPALAIEAGRALAVNLLDPLVETFGPIDIRSAYRAPELNHFGATSVRPQKCAANPKNYAGHIWDRRDAKGRMGACTSLSIPWFARRYAEGRDWRDLAWWLWDHLDFHEVYFFPKTAAFNLTWREAPRKRILSYIRPKGLLASAQHPPPPDRASRYADFPPFRAVKYPD
ncbi:hypothetical protein [Dinoroseobacter sp. S76]|uniref:hypothetical protein n=1 Tax=Dinoroseobacter sp. S76 TaxID=3415124 RepID=UPI003C79DC3E